MNLSGEEIQGKFNIWLKAWDKYDLDGVMEFMHDEVIFENWDARIIKGKSVLRKAWIVWFLNHGNFKFHFEDLFIDEKQQKLAFRWCLAWPSLEPDYKGKHEVRRGVDIIHLTDGKISLKLSYCQTNIQIDSESIVLQANQPNIIQRTT